MTAQSYLYHAGHLEFCRTKIQILRVGATRNRILFPNVPYLLMQVELTINYYEDSGHGRKRHDTGIEAGPKVWTVYCPGPTGGGG